MSKYRSIAMIGGTTACALGIGFFMQRDRDVVEPLTSLSLADVFQTELLPGKSEAARLKDDVQLELESITLTSAVSESEPVEAADLQTLPVAPADPVTPKLGCGIHAIGKVAHMATVELSVTAPCLPNERLTVHHNGMMFTDVTDDYGQLSVTVPALAENAVFVAAFSNGKGVVARVDVPELSDYDRVVLQWAGIKGFQVHAREFGANYGEAGHVWSGSAPDASTGVVTPLGEPHTLAPQLAEIYTYPTRVSGRAGTVALSFEAEVTDGNCGRDVAAQSLELRGGGALRTRDLVLSVPDCNAIGDFLVLNNLVDDLKIAAN